MNFFLPPLWSISLTFPAPIADSENILPIPIWRPSSYWLSIYQSISRQPAHTFIPGLPRLNSSIYWSFLSRLQEEEIGPRRNGWTQQKKLQSRKSWINEKFCSCSCYSLPQFLLATWLSVTLPSPTKYFDPSHSLWENICFPPVPAVGFSSVGPSESHLAVTITSWTGQKWISGTILISTHKVFSCHFGMGFRKIPMSTMRN